MSDKALPEKPALKTAGTRIVQGRSPAYPYISLEKAVDRAALVRDAGAARQSLSAETFYKLWGLGPQSSGSRQTLAALNHFGLVDYLGRGDDRKVKLTELALRILLDKQPDSPERISALQEAALSPSIHQELFNKFNFMLPADVVILTYLTRDRGYNEQAAVALLDEYKATLAFSNLNQPWNMPTQADRTPNSSDRKVDIAVGDLIQVEIDGALQLEHPSRVRAIQQHEGQSWVFIEGSATGIPMTQALLEAKGNAGPSSAPPTLAELSEVTPKYVTPSLSTSGESEMLHGPLSRSVSYRLLVRGEVGPKELGKLIKILQLQKSLLEDDDALGGDEDI